MKTVTVDLGERSYPIYVEDGCLTNIGEFLAKHYSGKRTALITDSIVKNYYASPVEKSLKDSGFEVTLVEMPPGEPFKTLSVLESVFDRLIEQRFSRDTVIISLGGGVVGDLAGFAASALLRGVKFVQIPTTIIAQTDSSVGGKVAVNHRLGKNLIGAFYQPLFVFIDPAVLKTLPPREVNAGMSEVIKYGAIKDEAFFTFIEENCESLKNLQDIEKIEKAVIRSCEIKAEVVAIDEKESGLRRILNFGHTIGHAIENITGYKVYLHGEAVALGMIAAGWISAELGMLDKDKFERLEKVIRKIDIPNLIISDTARNKKTDTRLLEAVARDKKVKEGKVNFVLLNDIGKTVIRNDVPDELIIEAFNYLTENIK